MEGWKEALCLCSQCHFPVGLPVSTYLRYKIFQSENDISSGKDTLCSLFPSFFFTYYFPISGYSQLNMNYITGVSQKVEYEKTIR